MTQLRDHMQAIYDKHGRLEPRLVVDEARDSGHPLHSRFEWDDCVAAEKYRLDQAHDLITSIKIVFRGQSEPERQRTVRAFHAVRDAKGFAYEPTEKVVRDPVVREMVLGDMQREWKQLYERYKTFSEFAEMVQRDLELVSA